MVCSPFIRFNHDVLRKSRRYNEFKLLSDMLFYQRNMQETKNFLTQSLSMGQLQSTDNLSVVYRYRLNDSTGECLFMHAQWGHSYWMLYLGSLNQFSMAV